MVLLVHGMHANREKKPRLKSKTIFQQIRGVVIQKVQKGLYYDDNPFCDIHMHKYTQYT